MPSTVLLSLAFVTGVTGMAWFALAKLPHWRQVTGEEWQHGGTRSALRFAGAVALGVSLGLCLAADHITMSFLVWIMIQAAGALGVALLLAFRPRTLRWIALRTDR
jgi:hypothetical protein